MPGKPAQSVIKRTIGLLLSALGLLCLTPVLVACAIAIRLDSPGPVFFCQERLGHPGKAFRVYKSRTMVVGAHDGRVKVRGRDPRVTHVGAFLRKWSIDEIP